MRSIRRTSNLGLLPKQPVTAEKGNSDYDIRHRFTVSTTYDLPSRKSWGQLLEGWQMTVYSNTKLVPRALYDNSNDWR